ncbi:LacI family DNA-binding transcriptional regulator [Staphylococcus roterodami]|nr:LacI family DNA-binding transcriptional regulator [Staphylococcus roterodami]
MKNISDIAKLAGVSKSTVSRFLNNGSVSKKTSEKLTKIIDEHDYQPNQFAQSLRARQTHLIGAIIPRMNSYAVDETIKGLAKQCEKYGSQLILNYTGLNIEAEIQALETLARSKVDGIVLMATDITKKHIEVINKMKVPTVIVGQQHEQLHSIVHDDYKAGQIIGEWIGQQDYRHVEVFSVSEKDIAVGIHRKRGLLDQLAKYQITPNVHESNFTYNDAQQDVAQVLKNVKQVDAIVGATDTIALAAYKYYSGKEDAMKPKQIYGFGGNPMTQLVSPTIKTIHYNYYEAGQCAMEEIQQMLKKKDLPYSVTVEVSI